MSKQPKPIRTDADGTNWWAFLYVYEWDGATYCFDIVAKSKEEADARLKRLPLARYIGQGCGGPIPLRRGWHVPLLVWWRNWRAAA